jgi:hypothetical protein
MLPSRTHNSENVAEPFELKMSPEASQLRTPSALHIDVVSHVTLTEAGCIEYFLTGHFLKNALLSLSTDDFDNILP